MCEVCRHKGEWQRGLIVPLGPGMGDALREYIERHPRGIDTPSGTPVLPPTVFHSELEGHLGGAGGNKVGSRHFGSFLPSLPWAGVLPVLGGGKTHPVDASEKPLPGVRALGRRGDWQGKSCATHRPENVLDWGIRQMSLGGKQSLGFVLFSVSSTSQSHGSYPDILQPVREAANETLGHWLASSQGR